MTLRWELGADVGTITIAVEPEVYDCSNEGAPPDAGGGAEEPDEGGCATVWATR